MNESALYSKYRPLKFNDLIGQNNVKKYFENVIKKSSLSHAYLFSGIRGTGKTTIARIIAMIVNCENGPSIDYDPNSKICQMIINSQCPDVVELDAATNKSIDDIREIKNLARQKPIMCRKKVFIIDEAHCLLKNSVSGLLKILEEPPKHCIFILATTEPQNIMDTILSRCIRFDLHSIPFNDIKKRLSYICDKENIKYDNESIAIIAKKSHGSLRDAIIC